MGVPKRRTSRSRLRTRRRAHRHETVAVQRCAKCGAAHRPHRACPSCGYYRGRQVLTIQTDEA